MWYVYLMAVYTAFCFSFVNAHAGETQKVCHKQKDNKGKEVQVCKEVKLHKKLDGTKVPPK